VAFTALAAITVIVAALLLATGEPKVALTTTRTTLPNLPLPPAHAATTVRRVQASAAAPVEWVLLIVAIAAVGFSVWLWLRWRRSQPPIASPGRQTNR
jgi:hypothetical protein